MILDSPTERRADRRPEQVADLLQERAAKARERTTDQALARMSDADVAAIMSELITAAPNTISRRALEMMAADNPRLCASLRAVVFSRFCPREGPSTAPEAAKRTLDQFHATAGQPEGKA